MSKKPFVVFHAIFYILQKISKCIGFIQWVDFVLNICWRTVCDNYIDFIACFFDIIQFTKKIFGSGYVEKFLREVYTIEDCKKLKKLLENI